MAQTGFTPILLYSTSTAAAAPAVGNLTNSTLGSELAINITDGKLFYKDNANAIQVIAWKVTPATAGGTGQTSYAIGDILYANTTTTLAKLADVATGNALISGGVGIAPSWGKIGLTTHISGVLPVANGGTNASTASITSFNNITGYSASGATGTTTTNLVFSTNPSITTPTLVGNVTVSTENIVIGTSGKGIDFSATAGSGTSELLDDYEEGYFNPTLTCGTSGTITLTAAEDTLAYTKIGRVVYISGQFAISSVASPVGTVTMNNLPFAVASLDERAESAIFNVVLSNTTLNTPTFFGLITTAGGTTLLIRAKDNAGAINSSPASLFAASDVWISGYYLTAA